MKVQPLVNIHPPPQPLPLPQPHLEDQVSSHGALDFLEDTSALVYISAGAVGAPGPPHGLLAALEGCAGHCLWVTRNLPGPVMPGPVCVIT